MKYLLLSAIVLGLFVLKVEASEPKYMTEEVCEVPTGCPFVEGKCIGCITKKLHPPAPTINKYTTNNFNKTEIHNHATEVVTEIIREIVKVPVISELKIVHEMVTISEPMERLRPYISVDDNDKISILGVRHLGNNVWTFKMKARGKSSRCTSSRITTNFTGGGASCNNEFFHYSVDWE